MEQHELEEQGPSLEDYIDILRRRKFYLIFSAPVIFLIATAIILSLPPLYQSKGVILIQDQEIPEDMIRSTVTEFAEKQIETTRQRLMTSAKILDIIEKYTLYPEKTSVSTINELTDQFKNSVSVNMISADNANRRGKTNVAFTVAFLDADPKKAQLVANELATLFLEENVRSRTSKADETAKFLKEEADRMQARVQETEDSIAEFKAEFGDSLPELLEFNLQQVERIEQQLLSSQEESIKMNEQIHSLNLQLTNISPYMQFSSSVRGGDVTPRQRLMDLRSQYRELSFQYSDSHPDIIRIKQEIDLAESTIKENQDPTNVEDADNPVYRQLQRQITSLNEELERIGSQRVELDKSLVTYNERVKKTHQVKRNYDELTRDYTNKLEKYQELRKKQLEANVAQNMEAENKASSFSLIEPPVMPDKPLKPNKKKLFVLAVGAAIGFGFGLMVLVELLSPGVRGVSANMKVFGQEPIAVLPQIYTLHDIRTIQKNRKIFFAVLVVLGLISLVAFHFIIMELDILWMKVLNKINLL